MENVQRLARERFRRLYYAGAVLVVVLTIGIFVIPSYLDLRAELDRKIEQLSAGILEQKRAFIEAVVVEKISDIERARANLVSAAPGLEPGEFDRQFREEVHQLIHSTVLPDNGYLWINEIVNYEGGEDYAIRFVHPNLPETEGIYLSTSATDIRGNLPYLEELVGVRRDGEIFFDYYFKKMDSDLVSHKLTYAKLYEPYDWVVATGVYLDDVDALVESETRNMRASMSATVARGVAAVLVGTAVLLVMTVVFETRIRRLIDSYVETERAMGVQLRQEKAKLQESNVQKDRLLSIVAHDLRNPVTSLATGITMLDETSRGRLDEVGRTVVDEMKTGAARISSLLEHLLDWSQTQKESVGFHPERVELESIVEEACDHLRGVSRQKSIALFNRVAPGTSVYADRRMLATIIRNLVSNGIKFTPRGGSVSVESERTAHAVRVVVHDTGVGIDESDQKTLFAVNASRGTRGTEGEKGTGLGLNLCYELVQRHGGNVEVASTPGQGSTFTVVLPDSE